jgi:hypothetical protein
MASERTSPPIGPVTSQPMTRSASESEASSSGAAAEAARGAASSAANVSSRKSLVSLFIIRIIVGAF